MQRTDMTFGNKHGKLAAFLGLILLVLILDNHFGWSEYLQDMENLRFLQNDIQGNLFRALAIYTLLTVVGCVVLALPGITFAVFAGILFGPWLGTLACLLATTIGAILAFLAGRFFLRDSIQPLVMKNKWIKKVLFDEPGRNDMVILMITRLVPIFPYNLQNFAYGITEISLTSYSVYTFLFLFPGVAAFTVGAAGFTEEQNRWVYFATAGVLFAVVFLLGGFIRKKYLTESDNCESVCCEK